MAHEGFVISRRAFAGLALATGLSAAHRALAAPALTADSPMGPFYPVTRLAENDADLTWLKGHSQRALGTVIEVTGRVLDRRGNPVDSARVELWQCNAAGRYAHPADVAAAPLDPNFQGFASLTTRADGEWRITTVKPASYASPIGQRTPHIHFVIDGRSHRLVAQMYFPEDAETNRRDTLYRALGDAAATSVAHADGGGRYRWDVVLMEG
jgi:protocatechuate 3,4-dioxygenase beta subunit